ncbi:hypothetical protein [Fictibacillus gelatini]|uniref:hypothetical protein n=1 Tax=Fictibacillus gelatini TaxID=225985 RepID=UPI00055795FB|nr:hypothetical protein [Fictibacillus gelatini]
MIRMDNGIYISFLGCRVVKIIYQEKNRCELYINDEFKGIGPFDYTKEKINELERKRKNQKFPYHLYEFHPILPIIDRTI